MKKIYLLMLPILFACSNITEAQTSSVIIQPTINLPKDTVLKTKMVSSLNTFLDLKEKPNVDNYLVNPNDLLETHLLLDEMKEVEKSGKYKDNLFYKPYLSNVVTLSKSAYFIQLSYIGINENAPLLRAIFSFLANYDGEKFTFSSPLKRNTSVWKTQTIGDFTFHFKKEVNKNKVKEYQKYITLFDSKLKAKPQKTDIYCFSDFPEAIQSAGVEYSSAYNGFNANSSFSAGTYNEKVIVAISENGDFGYFDPHDLWHARLNRVASPDKINKQVDEGCAFLYAGSWGMTWAEIKNKFDEKLRNKPDNDWLKLFETRYDFGDSEAKRLNFNYFINALIIQKIEREKGLEALFELVTCGKYEKENKAYFEVLEKLTGINKTNFNAKVEELLKLEL
jgi:hypothetical protein